LVNIGWNEGAVGVALSLMGFTALVVQTFVGDIIDKATVDRRKILSLAASVTACAALTILFVREGNQDHALMFVSKVLEGIAVSFINPCLAALTLASFGPGEFDSVMANNVLWSHNGSFISAILAGAAAYIFYPNIKYCFFVIAFSAAAAVSFIPFLPQGDPLMGRGFHVEEKNKEDVIVNEEASKRDVEAASYLSVLLERKTLVLCLSGFFFQ
jgi:MFS family permease